MCFYVGLQVFDLAPVVTSIQKQLCHQIVFEVVNILLIVGCSSWLDCHNIWGVGELTLRSCSEVVKSFGFDSLGASPEEAFVVLEHTIRGVGGFGTSHKEVLVALERGKQRCWWFRDITRRSAGGVGTSQEEVLVVSEQHKNKF